MTRRAVLLILILGSGVWFASSALAQKTSIHDPENYDPDNAISRSRDPSGPLFPKEPEECKVFRKEWNARVNALRDEVDACKAITKAKYDVVERNARLKLREHPECSGVGRTSLIYSDCVPDWLEYCRAGTRRDKQVRECFQSLAEAVPDDSEELHAIYDRMQDEVKDAYGKANKEKGIGPALARKLFGDQMSNIARIHKQALADLAQAKARLAVQEREAADRRRSVEQQRQFAANEQRLRAEVQSCKRAVSSSTESCHARCEDRDREKTDRYWDLVNSNRYSEARALRFERDNFLENCLDGCYAAADRGEDACENGASARALRQSEAERQRAEDRENARSERAARESARQTDDLLGVIIEGVAGGSGDRRSGSGSNSSMGPGGRGDAGRDSNCQTYNAATGITLYAKCSGRVGSQCSCPSGYSYGTTNCSGSLSNAEACRAIGSSARTVAYCWMHETNPVTNCDSGIRGNR